MIALLRLYPFNGGERKGVWIMRAPIEEEVDPPLLTVNNNVIYV
jgi:hypothetical protein